MYDGNVLNINHHGVYLQTILDVCRLGKQKKGLFLVAGHFQTVFSRHSIWLVITRNNVFEPKDLTR